VAGYCRAARGDGAAGPVGVRWVVCPQLDVGERHVIQPAAVVERHLIRLVAVVERDGIQLDVIRRVAVVGERICG
jgi:hypothetical protein